MLWMIFSGIQLAVTIVVGVYFFRQLRREKREDPSSRRDMPREM